MLDENLTLVDFLDESFQELVLALLLQDQDFLARARAILQPRYFAAKVYQDICKAVFAYWDEFHTQPSKDTTIVATTRLAKEEAIREAYKQTVLRLYTYGEDDLDKGFIQNELAYFAMRAEAAMAVVPAARDLKYFDIPKLSTDLNRIQQIPSHFTNLGVSVRDDWQLALIPDTRVIYPTGQPGIDRPLRGGARAGDLIVIVAASKVGKTLTLTNLGKWYMLMGCHVAHYTLEIYEQDTLARYLGTITRTPVNRLGQFPEAVEAGVYRLPMITKGSVHIKEFPAGTMTLEMMEGHFNLLKAKLRKETGDNDPKMVVIVDYLDLVKGPMVSEWEQKEQVYYQARNFARRHGVPFWSASQVNAGGMKAEEINQTHLSASTRKGFVVDCMFAAQQTKQDYEANRFCLVPFLNRNERKDLVSYWQADYPCQYIEEVTLDEYNMLLPDTHEIRGRRIGPLAGVI